MVSFGIGFSIFHLVFLAWKSAKFTSFYMLENLVKSSRFLGFPFHLVFLLGLSISYTDLVILARKSVKFTSFYLLGNQLKPACFLGSKTSLYFGVEIYWKSPLFLRQKSIDNQLVSLKITSNSGADIYWKSSQFLGQKSIEYPF